MPYQPERHRNRNAGRSNGPIVLLALLTACHRSPSVEAKADAVTDVLSLQDTKSDLVDSLDTVVADLTTGGDEASADVATHEPDASDVDSKTAPDVAVDAALDATPLQPMCGVPADATCTSSQACCTQACPAPYPCACSQGVACGWAPIAKAPKARFGAGSTFGSGKYWVFGGGSAADEYDGYNTQWLDGEVYDPATDTWEGIPAAPIQPTLAPTVVWGGDHLFVYGDTPPDDKLTAQQKALAYGAAWSPKSKTWLPLPKKNSPGPCGVSPRMAWTGTDLVLYGCKYYSGSVAARFAMSTMKWTAIAPPPLPEEYLKFDSGTWTGQALVSVAYLRPPLVKPYQITEHAKLLAYFPATDSWKMFDGLPSMDGPYVHGIVPTVDGVFILGRHGEDEKLSAYLHGQTQGDWEVFDLPAWLSTKCNMNSCYPRPILAWTGKYVVVWNGVNDAALQGGALFDPMLKTWKKLPALGQPGPLHEYSIGTDGEQVFVSHGTSPSYPYFTVLSSGAKFLLPP